MYKAEGKITHILPPQKGDKRGGGQWVKQEFVIETSGDNSDKMAFFMWDELANLKVGDIVAIDFVVKAREWNDKWFTNLLADKIEKISKGDAAIDAVSDDEYVPDFDSDFDDDFSEGLEGDLKF